MEPVEAALEWSRAFVDRNHIELVVAFGALATLAFLSNFIAFLQFNQLKKEVEALRRSSQRLMAAEEKRVIKELRGDQRL
jgi:hypothetical protein